MAAQGYPGAYKKDTVIRGLQHAGQVPGAHVFHAGTAHGAGGKVMSVGGRVLGVTALGQSVAEAQTRAYEAVSKIDWPEGFYRKDIGGRAVR
jgi:phosphoribosylamine--glycine ligase